MGGWWQGKGYSGRQAGGIARVNLRGWWQGKG